MKLFIKAYIISCIGIIMFVIPIDPNRSEPIRKDIGSSKFEIIFDRDREIRAHPEIAIFGGLSISNNSPDLVNVGFGRNSDAEKTDIMQAGGNLIMTTAPNKLWLQSQAGGVLTSNVTLYYDYYTADMLEMSREYAVDIFYDALQKLLPQIDQIVNKELHVTVEEESDTMLQKIIKKFRKSTGGT